MLGRPFPLLLRAALLLACAPCCAAIGQDGPPDRYQSLPEGAVLWASRAETISSPAEFPDEPYRLAEPEEVTRAQPGDAWPQGEVMQPFPCESVDCGPMFRRRWWLPAWGELAPDGRHRGLGDPLEGTSWLNRPYSFGLFTGGAFGGTLVSNSIVQRGGLLTGMRLGIDMHHYWGMEARWAFSRADVVFNNGGVSTTDDMFLDAHLLYYPWGDAHWRPYVSLGLGLARFQYTNPVAVIETETLAQMPIGLGVKYYLSNLMTARFDFYDNLAFGARDFSTLNNFSLTGGIEFRYGGRRTSYYPLDPSVHPR